MYIDCSGCPFGLVCARCARWRRLRNEARCLLIARLKYGLKIVHVHFPAECCLTMEEVYELEKEDQS